MQLKYSITLPLLVLGNIAFAQQNLPDLTQTSVPGTVIVTPNMPEVPNITNPNMVRLFAPLVPIDNALGVNTASPAGQVKQQITYSDGFNRPFQSITKNAVNVGGQLKNIVHITDNRVTKDQYSFLPYAANDGNYQSSAYQKQKAFYAAFYPNEGNTAFSKTQLTSSSAKRSSNTYTPGKSQVGQSRATETTIITNTVNDVISWGIDANGRPTPMGYYAPGELIGSQILSPLGNVGLETTKSYKDRDGRLILKMVADSNYNYTSGLVQMNKITYKKTYYVYGEKGELKYTLPPKLVQLYEDNPASFTATAIDNLSFQYQYDAKGRTIAARNPGEDKFTLSVYDRKDRLVMIQNPNENAIGEWQVTFYDANNRVKGTSVFVDNNTTHNQAWMQSQIDAWTGINNASLFFYLGCMEGENATPSETAIPGNYMLSYLWYDDYSKVDPNNTIWDTYASQLQFNEWLTTIGAEVPVRSIRTEGMATGSRLRIEPSLHPGINADPSTIGDWRTTAIFYDDKGRVIYNVSNDLYQSNAIHTHLTGIQYDFAGRTLISKHLMINKKSLDGTIQHIEWNKNEYDANTGSLVKTYHKVDNGSWTLQSSLAYDDLGRVKRKILGDNGEVQDFSYTIDGKLQGINGVYAETGNKEGASKTFGESLKYDYGFNQPRYDCKIAGIVWRGGSASNMYAYGYDYTQDGSLKRADFNTYNTNTLSWTHNALDYSVSGLYYDKNGNILKMNQRGMNPNTGPVDMDMMNYTYEAGGTSNRIQNITDGITANYYIGDFQDIAGATDYTYDASGNLLSDRNKGISSVTYNKRFNKPMAITISNTNGTGGILNAYDAGGTKVQEVSLTGSTLSTYDYIGNFVYLNGSLRYILTAEGRTMINSKPNIPIKEEYFVKDHLGNIRSVIDVTSYPIKKYLAEFELASSHIENLVFDHIDEVRDIKPGATPENTMAANLNGANPDQRIGTSLLVHVMAGDKVALNVKNYYNGYLANDDQPIDGQTMMNAVVGSLTGGVGGFAGSESHNVDLVQKIVNTNNYSIYNSIVNSQTDATKPKAYLNYILFDENMRIVKEMSGAFQANGDNAWTDIGTTSAMEIPQNGYLAVYLSNSSNRVSCSGCGSVYFDKLQVQLSHGNLLEENHYYPHGLPMAGLSSVEGLTETDGSLNGNRHKYQGNEYNKTLGLNWMDFMARQYDPQIGRFLGVDPLASMHGQDMYSPYAAMGNMPESAIDPNGERFKGGAPKTLQAQTAQYTGEAGGIAGGAGTSGFDGDFFSRFIQTSEAIDEAHQQMWAMTGGYTTEASTTKNEVASGENGNPLDDGPIYASANPNDIPTPSIYDKDPTNDPQVKEYEKNKDKMEKNSIKIDALSKLTKAGQVKFLIDEITAQWERNCGKKLSVIEKKDLIVELDRALSALGVVATTAEPKIQIAATIISGRYKAENLYLYGINEFKLKPSIEDKFPDYFNPKHHWGGGGAGGSYD